jgi:hypothetical protein
MKTFTALIAVMALGIFMVGITLTTSSSYGVTTNQASISAPSNLKMQRSPLIIIAASCRGNCLAKAKKCKKSCGKGSMGMNCKESCGTTKRQCYANC